MAEGAGGSSGGWFSRWGPSHVIGMLMTACLAMVAAGLLALVRVMHPFMLAAEQAMKKMEGAAEEMEAAAAEMEEVALMLQRDLPPALEAMEDASREFEELGGSVKTIVAPFAGLPAKPAPKRKQVLRAAGAAAAENQKEGDRADPLDGLQGSVTGGPRHALTDIQDALMAAASLQDSDARKTMMPKVMRAFGGIPTVVDDWRERLRKMSATISPGTASDDEGAKAAEALPATRSAIVGGTSIDADDESSDGEGERFGSFLSALNPLAHGGDEDGGSDGAASSSTNDARSSHAALVAQSIDWAALSEEGVALTSVVIGSDSDPVSQHAVDDEVMDRLLKVQPQAAVDRGSDESSNGTGAALDTGAGDGQGGGMTAGQLRVAVESIDAWDHRAAEHRRAAAQVVQAAKGP